VCNATMHIEMDQSQAEDDDNIRRKDQDDELKRMAPGCVQV
jgi:hypothetical protein